MPTKDREVSGVVIPDLTKDNLAYASRFYGFDPATGEASSCGGGWSWGSGSSNSGQGYRTPKTAYPFWEFTKSLDEGQLRLPAFACLDISNGAYSILFIWDKRNDERLRRAVSERQPCRWPSAVPGARRGLFLFGRHLWTLSDAERLLSEDELRLVFLEAVDQERRKFERLKARFDRLAGASTDNRRDVIPEDVRMYVWRRDGGRCVHCGGNERLEYDHIIPVSKGGSSTDRNIQLLCELCNRRKSDTV